MICTATLIISMAPIDTAVRFSQLFPGSPVHIAAPRPHSVIWFDHRTEKVNQLRFSVIGTGAESFQLLITDALLPVIKRAQNQHPPDVRLGQGAQSTSGP